MSSDLRAASTAVYAVFALAGVLFAAFAARIPEVKAALGLTAGELGFTLLAISLGSLGGLPLAGWLVHRQGTARTVAAGIVAAAAGMSLAGFAVDLWDSRLWIFLALCLAGLGIGSWDVSMNIEGAAVERRLGRSIMPRYHAAFSAGTVVSAVAGVGASRGGIPVAVHLLAAAALVLGVGLWSVRRFLPDPDAEPAEATPAATRGPGLRAAWREPRTLLVGFVTLAAAFTEGTANDWLSVAFVEGHGVEPWAGVLALAVFLASMTAGRLAGTRLLDRHGRVPVLRVTFVLAVLGAGLVVWGGTVLAYLGAALWGLGASLGFPVGMSAAADDPSRAAARVSVVSTIGYLAFLGGPPVLGLLGDHVGVLRSLLAVAAMVALALLALPAVRPLPASKPPSAG